MIVIVHHFHDVHPHQIFVVVKDVLLMILMQRVIKIEDVEVDQLRQIQIVILIHRAAIQVVLVEVEAVVEVVILVVVVKVEVRVRVVIPQKVVVTVTPLLFHLVVTRHFAQMVMILQVKNPKNPRQSNCY